MERLVLARQIVTFGVACDIVAAALRECAGSRGEFGPDGGVGCDPVRERVFAVLDYGFGRLVAVVGCAGLAWGDGSVVDELKEVLSVAGDDSEFLAVFAESVELVGVGCL